jgi:uncharacterized protein related to proFAR isomerase
MQVVPVVDVRGGVAVAASRGDRANYRTLATPFSESADPFAVTNGLRTLFPFPILYVADLEGIEGRGADRVVQARLTETWPGSELWIDDGSASSEISNGRTVQSHVLGSESLVSLKDYEQARQKAGTSAPLSLDFRGDEFVGPRALLDNAVLWQARVIVMTLARVGSGEGPDFARLASIVARAGGREIYAAGGVRHGDDLRALRDIGVAGALVATALHTGKITSSDLAAIAAGS